MGQVVHGLSPPGAAVCSHWGYGASDVSTIRVTAPASGILEVTLSAPLFTFDFDIVGPDGPFVGVRRHLGLALFASTIPVQSRIDVRNPRYRRVAAAARVRADDEDAVGPVLQSSATVTEESMRNEWRHAALLIAVVSCALSLSTRRANSQAASCSRQCDQRKHSGRGQWIVVLVSGHSICRAADRQPSLAAAAACRALGAGDADRERHSAVPADLPGGFHHSFWVTRTAWS